MRFTGERILIRNDGEKKEQFIVGERRGVSPRVFEMGRYHRADARRSPTALSAG
jgi:hypothetical protein